MNPTSSEPVSSRIGSGGRIYQDSRVEDQMRAARAAGALDMAPWADRPEPSDNRPPPDPEPKQQEPEPAPTPAPTPAAEPGARRDWDRRETASTVIELVGMVALAAGGFLIHVWLGLFIAGICLIVIGVLTSRRFDT